MTILQPEVRVGGQQEVHAGVHLGRSLGSEGSGELHWHNTHCRLTSGLLCRSGMARQARELPGPRCMCATSPGWTDTSGWRPTSIMTSPRPGLAITGDFSLTASMRWRLVLLLSSPRSNECHSRSLCKPRAMTHRLNSSRSLTGATMKVEQPFFGFGCKIFFPFLATRLDFDLMPHTELPEENLMREYEDLMSQGLYEVTREITFYLRIAIRFYF